MKPHDRRPDWRSPTFWLWAIRTCDAKPVVLHAWFPAVKRGTWRSRKAKAALAHSITFPHASHSNVHDWPENPPDDWPREGAEPEQVGEVRGYRETVERMADGSARSDRLLALDAARCKDDDYLLTAHGFDPDEWEVIAARSSLWEQSTREGESVPLYASRITVRPRVPVLDLEALVAALNAVEPVTVEMPEPNGDKLLELDLFDMHWGVADLDHYQPTLARVLALMGASGASDLLLPIGSDWFHNDDFRGRTAKGTIIAGMDFTRAWADSLAFVTTVVLHALELGMAVHLVYVKGNHDESMSWAFVQALKERFPQVEVEDSIQERKLYVRGRVAVGLTHGDKGVRDLDRVFLAEFRDFAAARVKEIHGGHIHHEVTDDRYGVMVRRLPTAGKVDQWSRDQGYVGACRRFAAFVYGADALEAIHYV